MGKKSILKLAELLPENVSEETLNKVVTVIQETITEEVNERVKVLQAKTAAFLRANMQKIQEAAISELSESNEVYQDAMSFRKLKAVMGLDKVTISESAESKSIKELEEEVEVLVEQLEALAAESAKYKTLAIKYKRQARSVEDLTEEYEQKLANLNESANKPFKSSEKGLVITENLESKELGSANSFLSEEVLALMPEN